MRLKCTATMERVILRSLSCFKVFPPLRRRKTEAYLIMPHSGLALAPDGKHLFCTTAGENTVGMFEVDGETGLLDRKFVLPVSGDYPKDLVIFPDNQHIAVANHSSNSITTFKVDYEKNIIMMKGKPRKIETPNCINIWPVPDGEDIEDIEA